MTVPYICGTHDENTLKQINDVASRAVRTALMADGHVGYTMPIGGVAAYDNLVSPVGVGFDIACGNCAIRTDLVLDDLAGLTPDEARANPHRLASGRWLNEIASEIQHVISFGIGRKNNADDAPVDHPLFNAPAWGHVPNDEHGGWHRDELRDKARRQLGTVGSGNHYVDVFYDEQGRIWVGVHFGSRGLGHTIASGMLALSQGKKWGVRAEEREILLDVRDGLGYAYWDLMNLAGEYAYAGREWVTRKVVSILGGTEQEMVHNHHNFAWKEEHDLNVWSPAMGDYIETREVIVVRKGATPAFPGQQGFVGGSMGDDAVILQGRDTVKMANFSWCEQQRQMLFSTVHGAGRVMSRSAALGKRDRKTGQLKLGPDGSPLRVGLVSPEDMKAWLAKRGVILRGGGLDEAPQVYRRLPDVLAAQGETIEVLHTLTPIIVVMAGANEVDPYKD